MQQLAPAIVALPLLGFWGWMFRDMYNNEYLPPSAKNYWTMVFIFLNVFGAAWYYATEYKNRH